MARKTAKMSTDPDENKIEIHFTAVYNNGKVTVTDPKGECRTYDDVDDARLDVMLGLLAYAITARPPGINLKVMQMALKDSYEAQVEGNEDAIN